MLTFLLLASKKGRPLPEYLFNDSWRDPPDLHYVPKDSLTWSSTSGNMLLLAWETGPYLGGSSWHATEEGVTAFAGHLWPREEPWSGSGSWAMQLHGRLLQAGVSKLFEHLFGIYGVAHLRADGSGHVFSDPFGIGPIYLAESTDLVAVSSRAALAARAVAPREKEPPRDLESLGWLPYFSLVVGTSTGFRGVSVLPLGTYVEFDGNGGCSHKVWSRHVWRTPESAAWSRSQAIRRLVTDIKRNVRAIADLSIARKSLSLSGGKDSRLILAAMVAAKVQDRFEFVSGGPDASPDVEVARLLAQLVGKSVRRIEDYRGILSVDELDRRIRAQTFWSCGLVGAWDLLREPKPDTLGLTGHVGEVYRSHYARNFSIAERRDLRKFFRAKRFNAGGLLTDESARPYSDFVERWTDELLAQGEKPEDIPDLFYLHHRLRRWFGTVREITGLAPQAFPLQSLDGLRAAFRLGHDARRIDNLHFEAMWRLSRPLARAPFAGDSWHDDNFRAGFVRKILGGMLGVGPTGPYTNPGYQPPPQGWNQNWNAAVELFDRYLLAEPSNPIFDVIDYKRTEEAVRGKRELPHYGKACLFAALTAAIWLGRHELPERIDVGRSQNAG